MLAVLEIGGISIEVLKKDIKNVHLGVYPPEGHVRISAPLRMNLEAVRAFVVTKVGWIKRQRQKFQSQARESRREYLERESHFVWGRRYLMHVVEADVASSVELEHNRVVLRVRPGADELRRQSIVDEWYRTELKAAAWPLIHKWQPLLGVRVDRLFVQKMKTMWGSCTPEKRSIRLNAYLSRKPPTCLEYILVHEMAHLIEKRHNDRFLAIMDSYMPQWRTHRDQLNSAPLAHEDWTY
jgi:predicted metal-dependent hydrolase